ncbi:MAG: outer membrane beta-barrel protein [Bacteroidales bacterium]|nr:outer membrane beta-barrel protein [Bacteroidales bacterium]
MKKLVALIAVVFASVTLAHAQFGIIAGYNSSATTIKAAAESVSTASFWHAGVAYKINIGALAIQPALVYNMKGTNIDNLEYKTGYIEASAGVQLGLDLIVARPFIVAEPFIGYQVYGNEQALADITNKLEYGFGVGIGADVIKHLQLKVEWYTNLGPLANASVAVAKETLKNGNFSGIKITAGFFF